MKKEYIVHIAIKGKLNAVESFIFKTRIERSDFIVYSKILLDGFGYEYMISKEERSV